MLSQAKLAVVKPHNFLNTSWNLKLKLFVDLSVVLYALSLDEYLPCLFLKELLQNVGRNWENQLVHASDVMNLLFK